LLKVSDGIQLLLTQNMELTKEIHEVVRQERKG
jgi:hypothetical protein